MDFYSCIVMDVSLQCCYGVLQFPETLNSRGSCV
jgi:hypothetical protein